MNMNIKVKGSRKINLNDTIDIDCPECKKRHKKDVNWLKRNKKIKCNCGTVIDIDAKNFLNGMKKIEQAHNNLLRTLEKFGR